MWCHALFVILQLVLSVKAGSAKSRVYFQHSSTALWRNPTSSYFQKWLKETSNLKKIYISVPFVLHLMIVNLAVVVSLLMYGSTCGWGIFGWVTSHQGKQKDVLIIMKNSVSVFPWLNKRKSSSTGKSRVWNVMILAYLYLICVFLTSTKQLIGKKCTASLIAPCLE